MGYAYGVGQLKPKTPESTLSGVAIGLAVAMVLVACSVVLEKLLPSNERHTTGHEFAPI